MIGEAAGCVPVTDGPNLRILLAGGAAVVWADLDVLTRSRNATLLSWLLQNVVPEDVDPSGQPRWSVRLPDDIGDDVDVVNYLCAWAAEGPMRYEGVRPPPDRLHCSPLARLWGIRMINWMV